MSSIVRRCLLRLYRDNGKSVPLCSRLKPVRIEIQGSPTMSYLVLHMDKFKKEAVRGIQSHNRRERESHSNPDIDYQDRKSVV